MECLDALDSSGAAHFENTYKVNIPTVKAVIEMGILPLPILDTIVYSEEVFGVDDFWV